MGNRFVVGDDLMAGNYSRSAVNERFLDPNDRGIQDYSNGGTENKQASKEQSYPCWLINNRQFAHQRIQ
jgi:hypothetical protein